MVRSVDIDDEVFAAIQAKATPLVDDANSVLRRVLGLDTEPADSEPKPIASTRERRIDARRDDRTPQSWYGRPLLEALVDLGGGDFADVVQEHLFDAVKERLTELDLEQLDSGEYRWRKDVQWMRQKLADRGFISRERRGYWSITDDGRQALARGEL